MKQNLQLGLHSIAMFRQNANVKCHGTTCFYSAFIQIFSVVLIGASLSEPHSSVESGAEVSVLLLQANARHCRASLT